MQAIASSCAVRWGSGRHNLEGTHVKLPRCREGVRTRFRMYLDPPPTVPSIIAEMPIVKDHEHHKGSIRTTFAGPGSGLFFFQVILGFWAALVLFL